MGHLRQNYVRGETEILRHTHQTTTGQNILLNSHSTTENLFNDVLMINLIRIL